MISDWQHRSQLRSATIGVLVLAWSLLAVLAWTPLTRLGPGIDEVAHIGAAYRIVTAGDNYLNPEHPPLIKWLAGVAMGVGVDLPDAGLPAGVSRSAAQWAVGRQVLRNGDELNRDRLIRARLAVFVISAFGLAICTLFAWQIAGGIAGLCAALLYASSPTILAGSTMVLTDLPVGSFAIAASWLLWRWSRTGKATSCIAAGAMASLATLSKYSGLIAVVAVIVLVMAHSARRRDWRMGLAATTALLAGSVAATTLLLLGPIDVNSLVEGPGWIGRNHTEGYRYYFFGETSTEPFLWYFPAALLIKSTAPELIGLAAIVAVPALAAYRSARGRGPVNTHWLFLSVFPLGYLVAFMWAAPNTGHRYMMPLYPFVIVAASVTITKMTSNTGRALVGLLIVAHMASCAAALPDPLSYSNGIAGCRNIKLIRCFDDSNIDWGQTLPLVREHVQPLLSGDETISADLISGMPLSVVLPRGRYIEDAEWQNPRPELYVISAHVLVRRLIHVPGTTDSVLYGNLDSNCRVGNSHYVVDMRRATRAATCPLPAD